MGTIYEKIKKSSAFKANAALISGAADAAPTYQDLSTKGGKKPVKSEPVKTNEEKKDDTSVDEVVNTEENNENIVDGAGATGAAPAAAKYASPAKNVKDEIKKSMGKGFVGDKFGDVTETTTTTAGGRTGTSYENQKSNEDWIKYLENETDEQRKSRYEREEADGHRTASTVNKKYEVKENEEKVETTTPGTKSNYNMGWAESVNAKWAEGVQRRDAKQDLRQYNKELKRFDKGGLFSKKGSKMINPATGKPFESNVEYADFKMGKSGDRGADGNMDATQEFNQKIGTRRGRDTASKTETSTKKEQYDETKHGKKDDITFKDSSVTTTAKVVNNDTKNKDKDAVGKYKSPTKFGLKKKSPALNNFKYKK
jgi:hypothetical protein